MSTRKLEEHLTRLRMHLGCDLECQLPDLECTDHDLERLRMHLGCDLECQLPRLRMQDHDLERLRMHLGCDLGCKLPRLRMHIPRQGFQGVGWLARCGWQGRERGRWAGRSSHPYLYIPTHLATPPTCILPAQGNPTRAILPAQGTPPQTDRAGGACCAQARELHVSKHISLCLARNNI